MDWTEHAFIVLRNLKLIAASVDQHYRQDAENAAIIREAVAKATEAANLVGLDKGEGIQDEAVLGAWRTAVPNLIWCGKAVKASAHEIVFTDGSGVFNTINKMLSPNEAGQIEEVQAPRRRQERMSLRQMAAGENPVTSADAKLIDVATMALDTILNRDQIG
jgi:hypothetical protein